MCELFERYERTTAELLEEPSIRGDSYRLRGKGQGGAAT
jgi:hypothetical protein